MGIPGVLRERTLREWNMEAGARNDITFGEMISIVVISEPAVVPRMRRRPLRRPEG